MNNIERVLNELKLDGYNDDKEGRTEKFFIGHEARDGFNVLCVDGAKSIFRSIEKLTDKQVEKYAVKLAKSAAAAKLKELAKKFEDFDLELKSEHELAAWTA